MRKAGVFQGGWRMLGVVVALVVLPSLAPDLFDLSCPHHSAAHEGSGAHGGPAAPGHDRRPVPDHGHDGHEADGPETPPPDHAAPCTCAGNCPVSGSVSVPVTRIHVLPDMARHVAAPDGPTILEARAPTPYLLPFANAPPLA